MAGSNPERALSQTAATLAIAGPEQTVTVVPSERRVRAVRGGRAIADTCRALLVVTTGPGAPRPPVYAFPRSDVAWGLGPDGTASCPLAGPALLHSLIDASGASIAGAAWSYASPGGPLAPLADHVMFAWESAEEWFEEDERVFGHPTDPFHRADAIASSRHVEVTVAGVTIADSRRPVIVFETDRPARAYLPVADVRIDLLVPSPTRTRCPIKGVARYWSARIDGRRVVDVAWSYPFPVPQLPAIAGLLSFDVARVDALVIDGETIAP